MLKTPKVALITGAGRRIGAEIAHTLHASGMNVVLHHNHSEHETERLVTIFNEQRPHSAIKLQADLCDIGQIDKIVKQAAHEWDRLDVVVNNASRFYKTDVGVVTESDWSDLLDTNVKAPFFICQAARDYLHKQHGCIVNITDVHAERPMHDYSVYCISKAALGMLTQALAKEFGPFVRVNAVAPGTVVWPEGQNMLSDDAKQKILRRTALNRHGTAKDVAKAVWYLVHDADYVTGVVLAVDGGRSLHI